MKKFFLVLLILPFFSGCKSDPVEIMKKTSMALDLAGSQLQADAVTAHAEGILDEHQYQETLQVAAAAREAGGKIADTVRDLEKLGPEDRVKLYNILSVLSYYLQADRLQFIEDIGDERVRKGLTAGIMAFRTATNAAAIYLIFSGA